MTVVFVENSPSNSPVTPAKAGVPFGFFEFFSNLTKVNETKKDADFKEKNEVYFLVELKKRRQGEIS